MAKIQIPRKIRAEDFKSDQQELVNKIGEIYNQFSDEVYRALNGRLDNDNLNQQRAIIDVMIGSTGSLMSQPQIRLTVSGKIQGIIVLNAVNQVNPNTYPTTWPGCSFTINGNILTILNVTGLQNDSQYKLTLQLVV